MLTYKRSAPSELESVHSDSGPTTGQGDESFIEDLEVRNEELRQSLGEQQRKIVKLEHKLADKTLELENLSQDLEE